MILRDNYIKIYNNGNCHIEAAKALAVHPNYGFAISHLVLGIEELIKYQIIYAHNIEKDVFTTKEIKDIFENHQAKHKLIREFQNSISAEITKIRNDYIFKVSTDQNVEKEIEVLKNNRFCGIGSFLYTAYKESIFTDSEKKDFLNWLDNADKLKKDGFYVDYKNDKWKFPSDLTVTDYQTALRYADLILKQTEIIKSLDLTDEELINILNSEI